MNLGTFTLLKSGILVREFSIGMGPKIFSHIDKEGTAYTIRILPLGGYVRMVVGVMIRRKSRLERLPV